MIILVINLYLIANNLYPQHGKHIERQLQAQQNSFSLKLLGETGFLQF